MRWTALLALLGALPAGAAPGATSVRGSKHDLSVSGPGPIKAKDETQVCIFCHVAHSASSSAPSLSGRPDVGRTHVPYRSSTSSASVGAPTGSSRVCLSCHDGTIAVGQTIRRRIEMNAAAPGGLIPSDRKSNLGTDLRRTHPISVRGSKVKGLRKPPAHSAVRLDEAGEVQCTSCHDAHSEFGGSAEGKFLRDATEQARLCLQCHAVSSGSSHGRSPRPFGPTEGNERGYASVGAAGCSACHRSHGADIRGRLIARGDEDADDSLCLRCHSGSVARLDVAREMAKPYAHANRPGGRHDASEGPDNPRNRLPETSPSADRHVACVDCHDPHSATDRPALAPDAPGALAGAWGIDLFGNRVDPAAFEYQVCLKCHGDSANRRPSLPGASAAPRRRAGDDNLRRVFDPSAPSNHPVAGPARNPDVPSLIPPLGPGSYIYCTDCHSSDSRTGASTPRGPHGSVHPFLLERGYTIGERAFESPEAYALCYKCHNREVLLSPGSAFPLHRRHVVDGQAPCSVCHAAHGVSSYRGSATGNAHLVDFDLDVVRPGTGAAPPYVSLGPRSGSCALTCHGEQHDSASY